MNTKTSPLLIWATSDPHAGSCARALEDVQVGRVQVFPSTDALRGVIDQHPDATICLIYTAPARHLAHALDQDATLEQAVANWQTDTTALLSIHRQNRAHCTLLESGHLQRFSKTALTRLGLPDTAELAIPTIEPAGAITVLMADTHLRNIPTLTNLAEEQAASSTILSNDAILEEPVATQAALLAQRTQRMQAAEQDKAITRLQAEIDTLLGEVEKGRKASESAELDKAQHAADITALELRLAETKGARDILQNQSSVLLSELRVATEQSLQQTQEIDRLNRDLGHQLHLHEEQARKIAEIEADRDMRIHGLEAEIGRIMTSRSMRLTAPLRSLLRIMGRKPDV